MILTLSNHIAFQDLRPTDRTNDLAVIHDKVPSCSLTTASYIHAHTYIANTLR